MLIHKLMLPTLLSWSPEGSFCPMSLAPVDGEGLWFKGGKLAISFIRVKRGASSLDRAWAGQSYWILLGAVVLFRVQIAVRPQLSLHTAHCRHLELQCLEQLFCTGKVRCPQSCFSQELWTEGQAARFLQAAFYKPSQTGLKHKGKKVRLYFI